VLSSSIIRVWCSPLSTKYEFVDSLPDDFESHYTGGRDASAWPEFVPAPPDDPAQSGHEVRRLSK